MRTKRLASLAPAAHISFVTEKLEMRVYGDAALPTLIYLPGLHGDWTLVGGFRLAVSGRVRFVEMTYPRTLTWSLDDYAQGIETALAERGIGRGWLLGESFGSQVLWSIVGRGRFQAEGLVLAGGFVRHPMRWVVRLAECVGGNVPLSLVTRVLFGYAKVARLRFRHSPATLAGIHEFIARRTELDRRATIHRLRLIAQYDARPIAARATLPLYGITGLVDPVVPWCFVRPWLRRNCPSLRAYKVILRCDHTVLGTAAQAAARQVLQWMDERPGARAACLRPGEPATKANPTAGLDRQRSPGC